MRLKTVVASLAFAIALGCTESDPVSPPDGLSRVGLREGVTGTVVWRNFEGGFWAIQTDDGRNLDPHETLPAEFRVQNLRVRVKAEALDGVACFHQAGIIVAISEIRPR